MTDQGNLQSSQTEQKPDTYHEQQKLTRLADIADILSWIFLVIFLLVFGTIVYFIYYFYKNHAPIEQYLFNIQSILIPFILSGFAWIVLKIISEGTYLLMDIEDNTRR